MVIIMVGWLLKTRIINEEPTPGPNWKKKNTFGILKKLPTLPMATYPVRFKSLGMTNQNLKGH